MAFTLADLMTPEGQNKIADRLRENLAAAGQPVDSWAPSSVGGVENLRIDMVAGGMAQLMASRVAALVNGRLLPLATDTAENGYWLTYLGKKFYKLDKRPATYTIQNVALYTPAGSAPVTATFQPGDLVVKASSTGNVYRSITGGQFTGKNIWPNYPLILDPTVDQPLMIQFQAENPGASYSDGDGEINTMVTAPAGVRCLSIRPSDFTAARHTGFSSGTITGAWADPAVAPTRQAFYARIDSSGDAGAGMFSYSLDGGGTWSVSLPIQPTFPVPGAGMIVTFTRGSSPSFIEGDIIAILVQGSILQRGNDAETDAAFRARCSSRWPAISLIPVKGTIELWAKEASPEVVKVLSDANPNVPGGIIVKLASATGAASPQAVLAVEDYIGPRLLGYQGVGAPTSPAVPGSTSPQETVSVSSADKFQVMATGVVFVPRAQLASAQAGADSAWNAYLASLPIGGQTGAVVEIAELEDILANLGAQDLNIFINTQQSDLPIPFGQVAVPADGYTLLAGMVWTPV